MTIEPEHRQRRPNQRLWSLLRNPRALKAIIAMAIIFYRIVRLIIVIFGLSG